MVFGFPSSSETVRLLSASERNAITGNLEAFFASLPVSDYPHHVRLASEIAHITTEEHFNRGVEAIIRGLRVRLDAYPEIQPSTPEN